MYKKAEIEVTNRSGDKYSIDTNGVVVNETRHHILKGRIHNGYHLVCIKHKYHPVHRFVATAFIDNPDNKREVNHIDGNKANNNYHNLEWCTHKENMKHAVHTGLWVKKIGIEHGRCKTNEQEVRKVCFMLEQGFNWKTIKKSTQMTRNTYLNIRRRATWKHISCDYKF